MSKEILPLKMYYRFDNYLMYLIQDVTKKDTVDIIAFFSDLSKAVSTIGQEKKTGGGIRKEILDFFPGTSIPFRMMVKGSISRFVRNWDPVSKRFINEETKTFSCTVEVGFPEETLYMSEEKVERITEALLERELLGGGDIQLPAFDRPSPSTPKMYQKMMEDICGKAPPKPKRPGYDPDLSGVCRNCNRNNVGYSRCVCDDQLKGAPLDN
jgi:hypothetical protein